MIDDVFTSDDSLSLLDEHLSIEDTTGRAAGRQPSVETEEVFSVQSQVFSESHSFNSATSPAAALLIPTEHRKLKTENTRGLLSRGHAEIAVVLLSVGGFLSLRDSGHTQPQPLMAAVEADRRE